MKISFTQSGIRKNQSGLASIVVTLIIMLVITLIVLAAAKLSRREQQQVFDRQLNTQAYYAAESGVNDAIKKIEDNLADTTVVSKLIDNDYTDSCDGFMSAAGLTTPVLDGASNKVSYSCLLVDPTPTTWEGNINDSSRAIPIRDKGDQPFQTVTIAWQDIDDRTNFGCPGSDLPPLSSWSCQTPMLRFDIVPTTNSSRMALNNAQMSGFLVPTNAASPGSTTIAYAANNGTAPPVKVSVNCHTGNTPKYCKAVINGFVPVAGPNHYYLRLKSIYGGASVTVSAQRGSSDIELKDAQVVVDSTGKASDVLRRIQVRISLGGGINIPDYAIESSNSICKQLEINGSGTTTSVNPECPLN